MTDLIVPEPHHNDLLPAWAARLLAGAEPIAHAILRAGFGVVLITHGWPKLTGASHGSMGDPMGGSARLIETVLHLPAAPLLAWLVAILEMFGGMALVLGLGVRLVSALVAAEMVGICLALGPTWVWFDRGIEYPLLMGLLAAWFVFAGAGRISLGRAVGADL